MAEEFVSLEESLQRHIPENDRSEVFRILYGRKLP